MPSPEPGSEQKGPASWERWLEHQWSPGLSGPEGWAPRKMRKLLAVSSGHHLRRRPLPGSRQIQLGGRVGTAWPNHPLFKRLPKARFLIQSPRFSQRLAICFQINRNTGLNGLNQDCRLAPPSPNWFGDKSEGWDVQVMQL